MQTLLTRSQPRRCIFRRTRTLDTTTHRTICITVSNARKHTLQNKHSVFTYGLLTGDTVAPTAGHLSVPCRCCDLTCWRNIVSLRWAPSPNSRPLRSRMSARFVDTRAAALLSCTSTSACATTAVCLTPPGRRASPASCISDFRASCSTTCSCDTTSVPDWMFGVQIAARDKREPRQTREVASDSCRHVQGVRLQLLRTSLRSQSERRKAQRNLCRATVNWICCWPLIQRGVWTLTNLLGGWVGLNVTFRTLRLCRPFKIGGGVDLKTLGATIH